MDAPAPTKFVVNGVIADLSSETLHGADGKPVTLRPQAFAVLRYLVMNSGRLVTKRELMEAIWPSTAVTDDSLVQCIHEIRRAIRDDRQEILKTVSRRGYRLEAPAAHGAAKIVKPSGSAGARRALALAAIALALSAAALGGWWLSRPAATDIPLVAVLPLQAVNSDPTSQLFAGGLTDDIVTDLGRFPEFEVLASGTTERYRGSPDPRAVAAELHASFVVVGSIAHQSERVRITAQLIDARTGGVLWADRWDRPAADMFAVQTEISEQIANRLGGGAGLVQETGRNAARRKPPSDLNAYELYLLGTERLEMVTRPEVEQSITLLGKAVELDPGFARAWIELYHAHSVLAGFGVDPDRNISVAREAAERAIALDPSDAEAHAIIGWSYGDRGDFARAKAEFDTALAMAPNAAEILTFYAAWASTFGEPARGAEIVDRVMRLEPNFPMWKARIFMYAYFMAERYEDALGMAARLTTDTYQRDHWVYHAGALAAVGRTDEARALAEKAVAARPDLTVEVLANEPGYSKAEREHLTQAMRLAGFPLCATADALARFANPVRLPECSSP